MKTIHSVKYVVCLMLFCLCIVVTTNANAATVIYTLDNVILDDGEQITGTFYWTYDSDDFEGGNGVFTSLEIPWLPSGTGPPLEQEGMNLIIESNQIEISLDGNFHDFGLDISIKFEEPLSPTQPSLIDPNTSFFECCGNGFKNQDFQSGSISPIPDPADLVHVRLSGQQHNADTERMDEEVFQGHRDGIHAS